MSNECYICGYQSGNVTLNSSFGNIYHVCKKCIEFRFEGVDGDEIEEAEEQMAEEKFTDLYKTFQYRRGHILKRDARGDTDIWVGGRRPGHYNP